jgi:histidinol phosphatase-like PHP family hydrolase
MDVNAVAAALLRDLAAVQTSPQKRFAYRRAAAAVFELADPLTALVDASGTLRKIPGIGPASTRVIMDVLADGGSPAVERAIADSGKRIEIERQRQLRQRFFSRAEVERILADRGLPHPVPQPYLGDLQVHSEWSDGAPTLGDLAAAGLAQGYAFIGVTDHSHGLRIARGISMADVVRQHAEIDRVNQAHDLRFRLIKGIEANIDPDGHLDLSAQEVPVFELVLAAPHSQLRRTEDQTKRLLAAVTTPGVHILAHPRGRMSGTRAGIVADWPRVFAAARRADVAIEIDGDPSRQDLDYEMAAQALDAGCLFALDSDAHDTDQFWYSDIARAHARLAGIPASRIVNCWDTPTLLEWLADKSRPRGRTRRSRRGPTLPGPT